MVREINYGKDHEVHLKSKCELDAQTDIICTGNNFQLMTYAGLTCNTRGFHDLFGAMTNVPVARVDMAYLWKQM